MTTSTQRQLRRGTTAQIAAMTPAAGELLYDTTLKRLVIGDGVTLGGILLPSFISPAFVTPSRTTTPTPNTASSQLADMNAVQQSLSGGPVNLGRNPAPDVWQRGTSGTITAGTPGYTADGWIVGSSGANVTWAQVAGRANTKFGLKVTGNTSVTGVTLDHKIESSLCNRLYPQATVQITVQLKLYNNTGGAIIPLLSAGHASALDNFTTVTDDTSAVSMSSCPNTALTTIAYTFTSAASMVNGTRVRFDFGNNFSSNAKSIEVAEFDVRITPGVSSGINLTPPTPELRNIGYELPFNQRYYETSFDPATAPADNAGVNTGTGFLASKAAATAMRTFIEFKVPKRTTPTVTLFNPSSGTAGQAYDANAGGSFSSCSSEVATTRGWRFVGTGNASTAVGNICGVGWAASAEL